MGTFTTRIAVLTSKAFSGPHVADSDLAELRRQLDKIVPSANRSIEKTAGGEVTIPDDYQVVDAPEFARLHLAQLPATTGVPLGAMQAGMRAGRLSHRTGAIYNPYTDSTIYNASYLLKPESRVWLPKGSAEGAEAEFVGRVMYQRIMAQHEQTHRWQAMRAPWARALVMAMDSQGGPRNTAEEEQMTDLLTLMESHAEYMEEQGAQEIEREIGLGISIPRRENHHVDPQGNVSGYVDIGTGGQFVRDVVEQVGMAGFNMVWDAPENVPTRQERARPQEWIARMGLPGAPHRRTTPKP